MVERFRMIYRADCFGPGFRRSSLWTRSRFGRIFPAAAGLAFSALLCACAGPALSASQADLSNKTGLSKAAAGDICERTMSFDVSGPYFAACRDYLVQHAAMPLPAADISRAEPAQHRACLKAGLSQGTPAYDRCVQQMSQLDISSVHL